MKFTEGDPGKTGKYSPAKIIGGVASLLSLLPIAGAFTPWLPVDLSMWEAIAGFTALNIVGAGLWAGLGKGGFKEILSHLAKRMG